MSTKSQRRAERQRLFEEESERRQVAEAVERERKSALGMWARIDEADASDDVKDILHRIAVHVGLEEG